MTLQQSGLGLTFGWQMTRDWGVQHLKDFLLCLFHLRHCCWHPVIDGYQDVRLWVLCALTVTLTP